MYLGAPGIVLLEDRVLETGLLRYRVCIPLHLLIEPSIGDIFGWVFQQVSGKDSRWEGVVCGIGPGTPPAPGSEHTTHMASGSEKKAAHRPLNRCRIKWTQKPEAPVGDHEILYPQFFWVPSMAVPLPFTFLKLTSRSVCQNKSKL